MARTKPLELVCDFCGKSFKRIRYKASQAKNHFCSHPCWLNYAQGERHGTWKGGKFSNGQGRILVRCPNHPKANIHGYVLQNRLIAEKALGKYLPEGAVVHHTKSLEDDRSIIICQDLTYHQIIHQRTRIVNAGGNPNSQLICSRCKEIKSKGEFGFNSNHGNGFYTYCRRCHNEYQKEKRRKYVRKMLKRFLQTEVALSRQKGSAHESNEEISRGQNRD